MKIVLELGKTHEGDMTFAKKMIDNAAELGVYAVKFQAYDLEDLDKRHKNYQRYKKSHLTIPQLRELKEYANYTGTTQQDA